MPGRLTSGMGRVGVGSRPRIFGSRYQAIRTYDQRDPTIEGKQSKSAIQPGKLILIRKEIIARMKIR
jgi:hypothetical protein